MKNIYKIKAGLLIAIMLLANSCKMDTVNLNAPTDADVLTTRAGIIGLSVGLRQYYSTNGIAASYFYPAVTSRELQGVATFTNVLELEAGGTALPTANGSILTLWANMQKQMSMSEDIISNAANISTLTGGTLSGVLANAKLFKAIALGTLATSFEKSNINTDKTGKATFLSRQAVLTEAIRLLNDAIAQLNATPVSADFTTNVAGANFNLKNVLYAFNARYNLMAGNYAAAITNATAVDLTSKNQFAYSSVSVNPLWNTAAILKYYVPRAGFGLPSTLFETGDQRESFYITTTVSGSTTTRTLKGFAADQLGSVPVYLPDEMKLIRAEALLRSNAPTSLVDALVLINEVRTQTSGDIFGVNAGLPAYTGAITKDALLVEVYRQRCAELYLTGQRLEDSRRFERPAPPTDISERNRNFYPYPDQERITNPNTPADPAI
ncbi:RagB/SusD family nutrient uptake outer membrane protein [Pedobacter sp. LMG 31464]|uniref:RagB/SusD family nutrient uptake outer membrane protein n=1 Tax=Pedobacter planticolens TaxID=2679964 RepID=A0A923DVM3_9SPHI|nr:RagB/SusD family nutrient uptake outer membrane protein [Pedobacter planticolens]MBB2143861.1 RagB/SusD family nutrient uptake outer membrane protein [Pedobacter planticolens]